MTPDIPPIFLIGYMGCGKTTFGRALAKATGRDFIDLDFYISQRFRASIPEIFASHGESGFRRMESAMLREVGEFPGVVVACGGGTPCFGSNIDYMLGRGTVVWLQASRRRLLERLLRGRQRRPLLAGKTDDQVAVAIDEGLRAREPFYSRASIRFNGDRLENRNQISATIDDFLTEFKDLFA